MLHPHLKRAVAGLLFAAPALACAQTQGPSVRSLVDSARPTTQAIAGGALGRERTFASDPQKAALRDEVFGYLGIDPHAGSLYVFVSTSMPIELLRAYTAEALWAGGVLVVRGIPDGMTLKQWISQYASPVVGHKGITAGISIDPMLFDLYAVTQVPTIVWDETDRLVGVDCDTATINKPGEGGRREGVRTCKSYPGDSYYRIAGAVTLDYALERFEAAGAQRASQRLTALRNYVQGGRKEQAGFNGDWNAYETAGMRAALDGNRKRLSRYTQVVDSFTAPMLDSDIARFGPGAYAPGLGALPR